MKTPTSLHAQRAAARGEFRSKGPSLRGSGREMGGREGRKPRAGHGEAACGPRPHSGWPRVLPPGVHPLRAGFPPRPASGVRRWGAPSPRALSSPARSSFPTCQTRGVGLGRLQDSRLPRPPVTSVPNSGTAPAIPGRARPSRAATPRPRHSKDAEEGAQGTSSPTWRGVGRRTWGPLGGGSTGLASGLCLRPRQWFPACRGRGR